MPWLEPQLSIYSCYRGWFQTPGFIRKKPWGILDKAVYTVTLGDSRNRGNICVYCLSNVKWAIYYIYIYFTYTRFHTTYTWVSRNLGGIRTDHGFSQNSGVLRLEGPARLGCNLWHREGLVFLGWVAPPKKWTDFLTFLTRIFQMRQLRENWAFHLINWSPSFSLIKKHSVFCIIYIYLIPDLWGIWSIFPTGNATCFLGVCIPVPWCNRLFVHHFIRSVRSGSIFRALPRPY